MAIIKYLRVGDTYDLKPNGCRWLKIPGHKADAEMSGVVLQSEDGTDYWLWMTDAGALYTKSSEPTHETTSGTQLSGGGVGDCVMAAVTSSLISDTDNTDDLGSDANQWKDLYVNGVANIDSLKADIAQIGDAGDTDYIKVADNGVLTMEGTLSRIDGVAAGNLVDKSATETVAGAWTFTGGVDVTTVGLEIKTDNIKLGFGAAGESDSYILFNGTDLEIEYRNRFLQQLRNLI